MKNFFLITLLACKALFGADELLDRIVVIVNDKIITEYELSNAVEIFLKANPPEAESRADAREKIREELIINLLIAQEILKNGKEITDYQITDAINSVKQQNNLTEDGLKEALKGQGKTYEEYREEIKNQLARYQYTNYMLQQKINISEEDIKNIYNKKYGNISENKYTLEAIFIKNRESTEAPEDNFEKTLEKLYGEASESKNLTEIYDTYSNIITDIEFLDLGELFLKDLSEDYREELKKYQKNEVTPPIKTAEGFYLFHVRNIVNRPVFEFEKVKKQLEADYLQDLREKYIKSFFEELKRKASITYLN